MLKLFFSFKDMLYNVKERVVLAPSSSSLASLEGYVTAELVEYHKKLSKGGSGVMFQRFIRISSEKTLAEKLAGSRDYRRICVFRRKRMDEECFKKPLNPWWSG
jgi:2,4-dienoyl-CoA reductase-like NADH-dependent reductase (Old Yellow Enzyme family)